VFFWRQASRNRRILHRAKCGGSDYGRYLLLPLPIRLPSLKERYHFLLAQAEAGTPRISPVISQGASIRPVQLITSQGTVTARYTSKKEPTPQVTAFPGTSTPWPRPLVSCRAMKPGGMPTASAVKSNNSRRDNQEQNVQQFLDQLRVVRLFSP